MYSIVKGKVVESEYGKFATIEEANKELAKRKKRNEANQARYDAMKSVGMKKTKYGWE